MTTRELNQSSDEYRQDASIHRMTTRKLNQSSDEYRQHANVHRMTTRKLIMQITAQKLRSNSKIYIWIIIIALTLSGLTAFPIETELDILVKNLGFLPHSLQNWLVTVQQALKSTNQNYPFLSYGTDWLAFAHLMLAILFLGPLKDPIKNEWVIEFGIICCVFIIPLALIAGNVRSIPLFWRFIDCAFGLVGIIPLLLCYKNIKKIKRLETNR